MKTPLLVVTTGLLLSPVALAQSPSSPESRDSMDRFFPLSESAATPPTYVRAETSGRATSGDAKTGYGISQQMEFVVIKGLSLRAGADLRNDSNGFTPSAQAKYQFLRQGEHGLNASAGVRYKNVGFQTGHEAEAFVSVGKRFGQVLATANLVAGRELGREEGDIEGHVGVGYLLAENLVVGANVRYQHEVENEAKVGRHPGREFEMMSGAMVGYGFGLVEMSLLGGWYMPRASNISGPMGMLRVGLNF